jgi:hypothetical protein
MAAEQKQGRRKEEGGGNMKEEGRERQFVLQWQ